MTVERIRKAGQNLPRVVAPIEEEKEKKKDTTSMITC